MQDLAMKNFWLFSKQPCIFRNLQIQAHAMIILMSIPKNGFSDVLNSGNIDSLRVLLCKVTTLKVTEAINV
jgi:hypothetical protein